MKILIIGRGGRESALVKKALLSPLVTEVFCTPGNGQTQNIATNINIEETNTQELLNFAKTNNIDLTIVGPESALEVGIVDEFQKNNLKIFGPTKLAATIESQKSFAKDLMKKYNIPTAQYKIFTDSTSAIEYAKNISYPHVIKYDGLAAGKGVIICQNLEEMKFHITDMLDNNQFGNLNKIILEEFLDGEEFTLLSLVKDAKVYPLEISRDYKKAYDNDEGLNTGGMGAICPFDKITTEQKNEAIQILNTTASSLVQENRNFTGILYGGFIATPNGVKVIEYNARLGDPECEVVLQKLDSDLIEEILNLLDNKPVTIKHNNLHYVGITLAALGYPKEYEKNILLNSYDDNGIFHMGTIIKDNKLLSTGGRVIFVSASGNTLQEARINAYKKIELFEDEKLFYRKDIGKH